MTYQDILSKAGKILELAKKGDTDNVNTELRQLTWLLRPYDLIHIKQVANNARKYFLDQVRANKPWQKEVVCSMIDLCQKLRTEIRHSS